jgi:hypothetical protein
MLTTVTSRLSDQGLFRVRLRSGASLSMSNAEMYLELVTQMPPPAQIGPKYHSALRTAIVARQLSGAISYRLEVSNRHHKEVQDAFFEQ